ncbi:hypothetical protein BU17DRAFT_46771 [Hysterangium stoloniferum]|nr:hypothetical protein BU17DRAFT_46771 [Hysterangium stoloniferum]
MELQSDDKIASLQSHLSHLNGLITRINTIRKIPGLLLTPSTFTGSQLEQGFEQIVDLRKVVEEPTTQESLKLSHESFQRKNDDDIGIKGRILSRKRRRPPSPVAGSPRPFTTLPDRIFPPSSQVTPLMLSELPSYIRSHNATESPVKLHIWTPTRNTEGITSFSRSKDVIVRVTIKEILYAYVRMGVEDPVRVLSEASNELRQGRLLMESITVFGPRERKSPHSQSDFVVFQKLSQHIAWMIQAEPDVELQSIVGMFGAYESLFVAQCTGCHRILSEEGHFPPVCRIWTQRAKESNQENSDNILDDADGQWEPRHRTCFSV